MVKASETAVSYMSQENVLGWAVPELSTEKEKRSTKFTHSDTFPKQCYMDSTSQMPCIA